MQHIRRYPIWIGPDFFVAEKAGPKTKYDLQEEEASLRCRQGVIMGIVNG